MMVNMGVAITLLMKKWADAHGLTMKEKAAEYILGANGTVVKILGITSMTLLLVRTLEIDVANVAICLGDFYQGLLVMYNRAYICINLHLFEYMQHVNCIYTYKYTC